MSEITKPEVIPNQVDSIKRKSNSAPGGIANPAFTMNEYYPIHLTPPGYPVIPSPDQLTLTREYSMMEIDQKAHAINWKLDQ